MPASAHATLSAWDVGFDNHARADCAPVIARVGNPPDRFVTHDQRILSRALAAEDRQITAAQPGSLDPHQDFARGEARHRNVAYRRQQRTFEDQGAHCSNVMYDPLRKSSLHPLGERGTRAMLA